MVVKKNLKKTIEKLTSEFLEEMGFSNIKINISPKEELFKINLESDGDGDGILIGYHGETISALQLLLSIFIYRKEKRWLKILVDVGGFRSQREEQIKELALKAAQRVKFSGNPVSLSGLSSFERRIVHMVLKDNSEIETRSEGESKWRMLVVAPKEKDELKEPETKTENGKRRKSI